MRIGFNYLLFIYLLIGTILKKLLDINYIGFPIIELKDKNKFYPIHYAIMYNNYNNLP